MMKRSTRGPATGGWLGRERMLKDMLPAWSAREWLGALALLVPVILAYLPVWHAGYVWDDTVYITHNPYLDDLRGLKAIWTSSIADISPLAFTTFWLEHQLWGTAQLPFHLVNVLQHGVCAVLLWRVLLALRVPGAWLGAALWALHPINAESVAWVSELKNTQSGFFYLLAILFFIRWLKQGIGKASWNYGLTFLFAALAMATKTSTVTLPGVLCLVAWWIEVRWTWRNLTRVLPFVVLSLAASVLSIWTQRFSLVTIIDPGLIRPLSERLVTAGVIPWFYLGKLIWPIPLMTAYPRWNLDTIRMTSWLPLLEVIATLCVLWLKRDSWARAPLFVFAYFLGVALPVLGLVDNYIFQYSLVFDHFLYLPSMAPMALAGACLARLAEGSPAWRSRLAAALLIALGTLTWLRATTFTSDEILWRHTVAENPDGWTGQENLATVLDALGKKDEAIIHYHKVMELYPNYAPPHVNMGLILLDRGKIDEAMAEFRTALAINPRSANAFNSMGNALLKQGKRDEALTQFEKAAAADPNLYEGQYNAAQVLLGQNKIDLAIEAFSKTLAIDPILPEAYNGLGLAFKKKGDIDRAIIGFRRSLELAPNKADVHINLGVALVQKGQLNDGVIEYQKALELDPKSAPAETNLGVALFQAGLRVEAMKHLRQAVDLDPASAEATNNLGNADLATGQLDAAIAQYLKALVLDATFSDAHRNLGVAYLSQNRPADAIPQFQAVLKINPTDSTTQALLNKAQQMASSKTTGK